MMSSLLLLLLSSFLLLTAALDLSFSQVTPPYRVPRVDENDLPRAHAFMNISGVSSLEGTLAYATSPTFSPMFLVTPEAEARGDFVITAAIAIPNSRDDIYACSPLQYNTTDEGETLLGKFILIERGLCTFGTKALNADDVGAAGVLLHGCPVEAPLNCAGRLANPLGLRC